MEYMNKSQYLPFAEDINTSDRAPDPRGMHLDPPMQNITQYSRDRAYITDKSLYARD